MIRGPALGQHLELENSMHVPDQALAQKKELNSCLLPDRTQSVTAGGVVQYRMSPLRR